MSLHTFLLVNFCKLVGELKFHLLKSTSSELAGVPRKTQLREIKYTRYDTMLLVLLVIATSLTRSKETPSDPRRLQKYQCTCDASIPCPPLPPPPLHLASRCAGAGYPARWATPRICWSAAGRARPDVQHTSRGNRRPILAVQKVFGLVQMWAILAVQIVGFNFNDFC